MNNKFRERLIKILKEATKQPGVVESLIKILNENLELDILNVYRLILKWQFGERSERVEKNLRNLIYEIWQDIKEVFTRWKNEHGVGEPGELWDFMSEHGVDLSKLVKSYREIEEKGFSEKETGDFKDELKDQLFSSGIIVPFEEEEIEDIMKELKDLYNPNEEDLVGIIIELSYSSWEGHPYAGERIPKILNQLDQIETVLSEADFVEVDDLIIQFDQMINLSHNTGQFLADYAPIRFEFLRKEIDSLGLEKIN